MATAAKKAGFPAAPRPDRNGRTGVGHALAAPEQRIRGVRGRYHLWRRATAGTAEGEHPFRRLAGADRWAALPAAVRARFERAIAGGASVTYGGEVVECRMSRLGRLLAWAARLIGGPLPLSCDTGVPATVTVTGDGRGGQHWTRQYGRVDERPQIIASVKRFAGPTGLEEYLGYGFGIALRLRVSDGVLFFLSDHYFLRIGRFRFRLPRLLDPGALTIGHVDCGDGRFAFMLDLAHPRLGVLMHQVAMFQDPIEGGRP